MCHVACRCSYVTCIVLYLLIYMLLSVLVILLVFFVKFAYYYVFVQNIIGCFVVMWIDVESITTRIHGIATS